MSDRTKWICYTGIGIALFVVFSLCLQVPVFENYYLCLGYLVMAVYCYSFGTISGTIVGTAGVILYCVLIGGLRGMPGWALGNVLIGLALGTAFKMSKNLANRWIQILICAIAIVASCAAGILGVKSLTECILYAQPMLVRVAKNSYAFVADVVVLLVSIPICRIVENRRKASGS